MKKVSTVVLIFIGSIPTILVLLFLLVSFAAKLYGWEGREFGLIPNSGNAVADFVVEEWLQPFYLFILFVFSSPLSLISSVGLWLLWRKTDNTQVLRRVKWASISMIAVPVASWMFLLMADFFDI